MPFEIRWLHVVELCRPNPVIWDRTQLKRHFQAAPPAPASRARAAAPPSTAPLPPAGRGASGRQRHKRKERERVGADGEDDHGFSRRPPPPFACHRCGPLRKMGQALLILLMGRFDRSGSPLRRKNCVQKNAGPEGGKREKNTKTRRADG